MLHRIVAALFLFATAACATLEDDESNKLTLATTSETKFEPVAFTTKTGRANYKYEGKSYTAEWITCRRKESQRTIFVMNRDRAGFAPKIFCEGWIAQAFLAAGFDVITVNRPGFEGSSGKADFAGPQSLEALIAGLDDALAKDKGLKRPEGAWGYSSGATAAALLAQKKVKDMKFLILGGGVYDLEETFAQTGDSYLKKELEALYAVGKDKAFEFRSIAYDSQGLPKRIALYHGKQDKAVPARQAESFRDSLLSEEYKVTLEVIDGVSHEIPASIHRNILQVLAHSMLIGG